MSAATDPDLLYWWCPDFHQDGVGFELDAGENVPGWPLERMSLTGADLRAMSAEARATVLGELETRLSRLRALSEVHSEAFAEGVLAGIFVETPQEDGSIDIDRAPDLDDDQEAAADRLEHHCEVAWRWEVQAQRLIACIRSIEAEEADA